MTTLAGVAPSVPWVLGPPRESAVRGERSAYEVAKRVFDVAVALAMLVLLAPLMGVVAALIKLTSRGPVVFKQMRAGLRGSPFMMYKFRTMRPGAEEARTSLQSRNEKDGPVFKIAKDPRLTPIGRWLRRSSIDELPQLINVLRGEMSLVGPRPLWMPEAIRVVGRARLRANVKPGLTCLWQISGRSELSYDEWVALDAYYVHHRGTLLDLMIMVQTIPAVLSARGAY
ncbi:MAG: sugar transferase [Phycisphaerae bacterium]|nr:sugar transferase [Phycisphaerae bacterium]